MSENPKDRLQEKITHTGPPGPTAGASGTSAPSTRATGPDEPKASSDLSGQSAIICRRFTENIPAAREEFKRLVLKDSDFDSGDRFFQKFGPGNTVRIDRPFERFVAYEELLEKLKEDDEKKYNKIHKGTPFYFLAWTAFHIKDFEKVVFYMDSAISEDINNVKGKHWTTLPAGHFFMLRKSGNQAAEKITLDLRKEIQNQLRRFNKFSQLSSLRISNFVSNYVKPLVKRDNDARSILTAFYSFVLEYTDRFRMLSLRSKKGGSLEPFLVHLFKGGLIFESLMKKENPRRDDDTLRDFLKDEKIQKKYHTGTIKAKFSGTIKEIINYCQGNNSSKVAFVTAAKIRNATGHNLALSDEFKDPNNYTLLYEQVINALLFIIAERLDRGAGS